MTTKIQQNGEVKGSTPSHHSLRGRLLGFVLVAIFLAAVLQAVTAYRGALQQADAMFDDHLQQVARSMRSGAPLLGPFTEDGIDESVFDLYVQIWGQDGTQLFQSARSALPPRAVLGFSDVAANGNRYRVFSLQTAQQTVQIAQNLSARTARAQAMAFRAVWPFALLTPLLMLAVWWVISRSLAPVERSRRQLALRAADDFSPLPVHELPDEVLPLVEELNLLFGRVRSAFDAQKNFVADAAHELRSPLTALKLQAQALARGQLQAGERQGLHGDDDSVSRLNDGIDRTIRLVEQLLMLAREESGEGSLQKGGEQVDLQDVIKLAVADVFAQASHKQLDLGVTEHHLAEPAMVAGQPESLRMMLRNLLDNAIKYTPPGGQVDVSLQAQAASAGQPPTWLLRVEDSGPGIAPEDLTRVFDRFYRAAHAGTEAGSGLGLAIVKIIADRHDARTDLGHSTRLGGLKVAICFARIPGPDTATPAGFAA